MSYIYVVQMNIPADREAEFNRVYDTEHVPMLSKVSGVNKVTRYRLEKSRRVGRLGAQDPSAHDRAPPRLLQENTRPA
jgi:hypothetical protein